MDLKKVREIVHSLRPWEYIQFMHEVHFDYPHKTKVLTEQIVNRWNNDQSMKEEQFNEIIKERAAEHTQEVREKRQADLNRIQEMRSRIGLDPLQLFPKEIWMMILTELHPEDKRNIRELHQIFTDLTDNCLIGEILLPLILDFEFGRFWCRAAIAFEKHGFRHKFHGRMGEHAELRLVSKSMRNAIDRWFEDDLVSKLHNGSRESKPSRVIQIQLLSKDELQKWKKMTTDLEDSLSPKPQHFFSRSLAFVTPKVDHTEYWYGDDPELLADFPQILDSILDHIGNQIWYFCFVFHYPCRELASSYPPALLENRYKSLLGWLTKMPNLKWLKIFVDKPQRQTRAFKIPEGSLAPTLPHLERLDVEFKKPNIYLMPICNHLLSANPHVKVLNLVGVDYHMDGLRGAVNLDLLRSPLTSLEVLMLSHPTEERYGWNGDEAYNDSLCDIDEFCRAKGGVDEAWVKDQLFAISSTTSPLTRIELKLESGNTCSLFQSLSHFQTLEKVVLSVGKLHFGEDTSFLKLPGLEHFEIDFKNRDDSYSSGQKVNWSFIFSLQFLMFAKRLKTLTWKCDMWDCGWTKVKRDIFESYRVGEFLDFTGGVYDIDDYSNLWKMFPWLEIVKVDRVIAGSGSKKETFSKMFRRCDRDLLDTSLSSSRSSSGQEEEEEESSA